MLLLYNLLQISTQLVVLLVTAAGWGCWISKLSRKSTFWNSENLLLCGLAGLCACWLFLQNLFYLDVRLAWSSWLAFAIAILGVYIVRAKLRASLATSQFPSAAGAVRGFLLLGLCVFVIQALGLIYHGPANYYGHAHQDQVNYVQLSQFLIEKPYSMTLADVDLHPWLVKGIDTKDIRIGQSIANAYLAVVCGTDAKSCYGTVSVAFVAIVAVTVFQLLKAFGVNRLLAWVGGLWCGLLPILTKTHLDGFFSQTITLFILPALVLAIRGIPRDPCIKLAISALLLSFLFSAYTEIYIVGAALCCTQIAAMFTIGPGRRVLWLTVAVGASLILVAPYVIPSATFLIHQYAVAANPDSLAALAPNAGSWLGWSELFVVSGNLSSRTKILSGFFFLGLVWAGLFSSNLGRRAQLVLLVGIPAAILALLLSAPHFSKYPFAKLLATFSPLIVTLAVLGISRLQLAIETAVGSIRVGRGRRIPPVKTSRFGLWTASVVIFIFSVAAAKDTWGMQRLVVENDGILAAVNSAEARNTYQELQDHPERDYLLKEEHPILNAWLTYHARHARVYVDVDKIGDRLVPSDQFLFRRIPGSLDSLWLLTGRGMRFFSNQKGSPELLVKNSQGSDTSGSLTWYWIGNNLEFEIISFQSTKAAYRLAMRAIAGPANPSQDRTLSFVNKKSSATTIVSFTSETRLSFDIDLEPGSNYFRLNIDQPTEWTVHFPTDAREHMVRIQELSLNAK